MRLRLAYRLSLLCGALALTGLVSPRVARADDVETLPTQPKVFAYGLLVGANHGGPGQGDLRWAEDDARKVAGVLRDVGRYGQSDMRVLAGPSPEEVMSALDVIGARLREHKNKGEQAVLLFYYSGHAKSSAIQLGTSELLLAGLREKLRAMPSTLTLVVLDACQSGAFARVKGAESASDFSYNSVARLTTQGIAVMASSTGQELSQESDELHSSYFTHHLLAGLRGAGDRDGDGRVTLDEAYAYAYRATLASTERTQVGAQHVTLETDLVGQGDVALSYPAAARSRLELPAAMGARVLVQQKRSLSVVAEVHKAPGRAVRIALASGDYDITVRDGQNAWRCSTPLAQDATTTLSLEGCAPLHDTARAKGEEEPVYVPGWRRELDRYRLEAGIGYSENVDDAYYSGLQRFRYSMNREERVSRPRINATLFRKFGDYLAVGAHARTLQTFSYTRTTGLDSTDANGSAWAGALIVRAVAPASLGHGAWLEGYLQGEGGFSRGLLEVTSSTLQNNHDETRWGTYAGASLGAAIGGPFAGAYMQAGWAYAPAFKNADAGQTHNAAGFQFLTGLRLATR